VGVQAAMGIGLHFLTAFLEPPPVYAFIWHFPQGLVVFQAQISPKEGTKRIRS
jgi:hypothetical protein